jgi:hypothetical protein
LPAGEVSLSPQVLGEESDVAVAVPIHAHISDILEKTMKQSELTSRS